MLDLSAHEITTSRRTAKNVRVEKYVGVVSVFFKPGRRKSMAEAADAINSVVALSADFPDATSDVPIVEDKIVEEDTTWDLTNFTSKHDSRPSPLQLIQELCRTTVFSLPSDVRSLQGVMKDIFVAFVSAGGGKSSLTDLKQSYAAKKKE